MPKLLEWETQLPFLFRDGLHLLLPGDVPLTLSSKDGEGLPHLFCVYRHLIFTLEAG